jgi:hypothetical protein
MKKLEKKIYNKWAFTDNEREKHLINIEIYKEIKDKATVKLIGSGYAHAKYEVVNNPDNLSTLELALICDGGNLCFGYRTEGKNIVIYTD